MAINHVTLYDESVLVPLKQNRKKYLYAFHLNGGVIIMIKKRDKFWTVIFAFIPGAGHMYNGFMKQGVSYMGLFFIVWAAASFANIWALGFILPVIWFYAFFDCINKTLQNDEDFYSQEDRYLFNKNFFSDENWEYVKNKKTIMGVILIVIGISALWNNILMKILLDWAHVPQFVSDMIYKMNHIVPELLVAILIIWAGIVLVTGKKNQIKGEEEEMIED